MLALLAAACGGGTPTREPTAAAPATPTPTPEAREAPADLEEGYGSEVGDRAPEFRGLASWINSNPLTMAGLHGKVVLVDFWTYTCVNCIRTFPYLKEWHEKYSDKGLVIVGVHSPEFEFEKDRDNVISAMREHGLEYPAAQDNDFQTWHAYDNRYWPTKYLIGAGGVVRYTHFGEGAYRETEAKIRELLEKSGASLGDVVASEEPSPKFDQRAFSPKPSTRLTRELYGGYSRNRVQGYVDYISHTAYYESPGEAHEYTDSGVHRNHYIYLQGLWRNDLESLIHARESEGFEDYIAIKFYATSVNAVIEPQGPEPFEVEVTIDSRALQREEAGADITTKDGRSYIVVNEPRMYRVVELSSFSGHELKLSAKSDDFAFFAFTFGAYEEGP